MSAEVPTSWFVEAPRNLDLVGLDADDTLWETEGGFQDIASRFEALMAPYLLALSLIHISEPTRPY